MPEQVDGSMTEGSVPLSMLALDVPEPPAGWAVAVAGLGAELLQDSLGRTAVNYATARTLIAQHREQQEAVARRRAELEQQAVEKDQAFRDSLPRGVPAGSLPEGVSVGLAMMLADPERQGSRRQSVLEHALEHPTGAIVIHPLRPEDAS